MTKVVKYALVSASSSEKLEQQVNERIAKGWQPFGSPFREGREICQALVLFAVDEKRIRKTSDD